LTNVIFINKLSEESIPNNQMIKYVTYKRVSTKEQSKSGLGIDAQARDIDTYLEHYSDKPFEILGEFTDILSGADDFRPELAKAIALAKKEQAVLLVAKLDRLSRKVAFIANLMEDKKLQFKVACLPQADKFQLHLYSALAEQERDFISQRTKSALREAKARGVKLGGLRDSTMKRNEARQATALAQAKKLERIIMPLREQGKTLRDIGQILDQADITTSRGGKWDATQVSRIITRLSAKKQT
jgi:DNA invertase Pin-like site-specific DNA recombinase